MPLETLLAVMVKIVIMVAFGFFLKRKGIIDDLFQKNLSTLLTRAVLPVSILGSGNSARAPGMAVGLALTALICVAYYVVSIAVMTPVSRRLPMKDDKRGVFATTSIFANTAFLGYPLALALYGNEGLLYAVIYNLGYSVFMYTAGVRLLDKDQPVNLKTFLDVRTFAAIAAIVLFVSPVRLPTMVVAAFADIGALSVPISMMIIGCSLATTKFSQLWTDKWSYVVSALRLVVFPFCMMGVLWGIGMRGVVPATCVLLTALPPGTLNVLLTEEYGGDLRFATYTVVQGMVLMLPALVLLLYCLGRAFF